MIDTILQRQKRCHKYIQKERKTGIMFKSFDIVKDGKFLYDGRQGINGPIFLS